MNARYREIAVGGCLQAAVKVQSDGLTYLESLEPLQPYAARMTDSLEKWAVERSNQTFVARRNSGGEWQRISYEAMLERVKAVGQYLVDLGLSADRPVAILSGNDLEHMTLSLAAMWVGVPYAPISTAYSLISKDFAKLRHVFDILDPGLVFAESDKYEAAINAVTKKNVEIVLASGKTDRVFKSFDDVLKTPYGDSGEAAHQQVTADTITKFLFTSGSTKAPKAVINTNRMQCSNQQMLQQCLPFLREDPPVLVDWLPWSHTFGSNHNIGLVLYNGGTLYIDDGSPTPHGMKETLRNLKEISPTLYFNVPKGFEEIANAMDLDEPLRNSLFRKVRAFKFAGAGLAQNVWDKLDQHAERAYGERIRIVTGLGMTETSPSCVMAVGTKTRSSHLGLPIPGVTVKLVPVQGKVEIRFSGPNVTPGYWKAPEQTADAFDEEGFYCTGDAVKFVDPLNPESGLSFDGRIAEDFKLSTGTFVSVGPLCAKVKAYGAPCVLDTVVAGINRSDIRLLVFPRLDECRRIADLPENEPPQMVLQHPKIRAHFQGLTDRLWLDGTGSATRPARLEVMTVPPSADKGEVTDKGSINQGLVLMHRAATVDALYDKASETAFMYKPSLLNI